MKSNNSARLGATGACYSPPLTSVPNGSASLELSASGLGFIRTWEKYKGNLYNDQAGHCTIGYGHLVHRGNCNGRSSEEEFMEGIDEKEASQMLDRKVDDYVKAVKKGVTVELTQFEFDALVAFAYNVGTKAFTDSHLLKLVNKGDWKNVRFEFMKWVHANNKVSKGLTNRRAAETEVFYSGNYQHAQPAERPKPAQPLQPINRSRPPFVLP